MENERKELIEKKTGFFEKLLLKIKSFFKKEEISSAEIKTVVERPDEIQTIAYDEDGNFIGFSKIAEMYLEEPPEHEFKKDIDPEAEKQRIKKLYEDVKNGLVNIDSLSGVDTIIINKLLKSEVEITKKKLT